jgi:LmbE family N-acetylglucosaminyl deacetylase
MKKILSIGAHPDDIEFGCGGTEAFLRKKGNDLIHVIATCGEEGSLTIPKMELAQIRNSESNASAAVLGVAEVHYLDLEDSLVQYTKESKIKLVSLIRQFQPDIVFTHCSQDPHPDHKVVHDLTKAAVMGASGPWHIEAGGTPYVVPNVLGYEVWSPITQPQCYFDISDEIELKLLALSCHKSQIVHFEYLKACKALAEYRGSMNNSGNLAEAFEVIRYEMKI